MEGFRKIHGLGAKSLWQFRFCWAKSAAVSRQFSKICSGFASVQQNLQRFRVSSAKSAAEIHYHSICIPSIALIVTSQNATSRTLFKVQSARRIRQNFQHRNYGVNEYSAGLRNQCSIATGYCNTLLQTIIKPIKQHYIRQYVPFGYPLMKLYRKFDILESTHTDSFWSSTHSNSCETLSNNFDIHKDYIISIHNKKSAELPLRIVAK